MLDWIFGSDKKEKKQDKKQLQLSQDQKWVYDFIRQYLTSPIWRNPILDHIQENCIVFQDVQQNKFQYTKIYQQFQGLATLLIQSMIQETGITQRTLQKCIFKGIKSQRDRKIFQQILLCDNFLAFKKIMVTKNKQLQLEALKKIQKQQPGKTDKIIQIDTKELQRMQIEKAIAMSMAIQEKAKAQQEKQLQQAIRLSQISHQQQKKKTETQKQQKSTEKSFLGSLPPLVIGTRKEFKPMQQLKKDEQELRKQIAEMKKGHVQESKQSIEQRKKRLMQQRELIKKKKQEQRQAELNSFVQNKQQGNQKIESKVSEQELVRRRNLMKKLKEQLKD